MQDYKPEVYEAVSGGIIAEVRCQAMGVIERSIESVLALGLQRGGVEQVR
jgi:hypothetical protein